MKPNLISPDLSRTFRNIDVIQKKMNDDAEDKVFLTCSVTPNDTGGFRVDIDPLGPAVFLNDKWATHCGFEGALTVKRVWESPNDGKTPHLLTGGCFVWGDHGGEEKLAVLQRDEGAPHYAGSWNEACGRVGHELLPMSGTSTKELLEEMIIAHGSEEISVLAVCSESFPKEIAVRMKQEQIERLGLDQLKGKPIEVIEMEPYTPEFLDTNEVEIYLGGDLIEKFKGCNFWTEEHKTLEVRVSLRLPPGVEISQVLDGEGYGRVGRMLSARDLVTEPMIPSLQKVVEGAVNFELKQDVARSSVIKKTGIPSL